MLHKFTISIHMKIAWKLEKRYTTELQGSLYVFLCDCNNEAVVSVMPYQTILYINIEKGRKKTCIKRALHVFFYYSIAGWFDHQMLRAMIPTSLNLNGLLSLRAILNFTFTVYCYYLVVSADISRTVQLCILPVLLR